MLETHHMEEEPPDPGVDERQTRSPQQMIEALKYSRRLLRVVESDSKMFEEDLRDWRQETTRELIDLQQRKDLVDNILQYAGDPPVEKDKPYLMDIWIQYGRSPVEALAFRGLSIQRVKVSATANSSGRRI